MLHTAPAKSWTGGFFWEKEESVDRVGDVFGLVDILFPIFCRPSSLLPPVWYRAFYSMTSISAEDAA